jgi:signal transduction histidine kinase
MGIFEHIASKRFRYAVVQCLIAGLAVALLTVVCYRLHFNLATASLLYVIVVVLLARAGSLASSIVASIAAAVCLAHLAPPTYSFGVDDPLDVVAIAAFLITSLVIARLVSSLRDMRDKAISSVNRRLIDAEERERTRIARELHDDINQRLALVSVGLEQVEQSPSKSFDELRGHVHELGQRISGISADVQAISHELYSSKLEYLGIAAATQSFCREFSEQHNVEIKFVSRNVPRHLSLEISIPLFRVLQEALRNSVKHSGARQFEVELFEASDAIHLIERDSGLGFNAEAAMKGSGLGLVSMQERMKLLKGEFSIDSQLNRGTTIRASAHLNRGNSSARADG